MLLFDAQLSVCPFIYPYLAEVCHKKRNEITFFMTVFPKVQIFYDYFEKVETKNSKIEQMNRAKK